MTSFLIRLLFLAKLGSLKSLEVCTETKLASDCIYARDAFG